MKQKIRLGMIGGGRGSFIGKVHHMAAILDNKMELVCGAFSSKPELSKLSGTKDYLLPDNRVYGSYEEMIEKETKLPKDTRMEAVAIVTPNHLHAHPAILALENGFHVICDKPLALNLQEAREIKQKVIETNLVFALTHVYTGYPMVKEARALIQSGKLGKIRKVISEYPQGWLATKLESTGQKQAGWRTDPEKSGISCTMGDIGTHAENLASYITGLKIKQLCADISTFVEGRDLDDDGNVLLRFDNGAKGILHASQICAGEENNMNIRIYGEKGGLEWRQEEPNSLIVKWLDKPRQILRTGIGGLSKQALEHARVPAGHPEGYIEAFANVYRNFAMAVDAFKDGKKSDTIYDFPTVDDGVEGMLFIEKVIESSGSDKKWIDFM